MHGRSGPYCAEKVAAYIQSRSARYAGALNIEPAWTAKVKGDERLVEVSPYLTSRVGATGFIRYSRSAGKVLVVIAYQDLDGDLHAMNSLRPALREDAQRLEGEASTGEPYPDGTVISRSSQAGRTFNVRLSEEQVAAIQAAAERQHLPHDHRGRQRHSWAPRLVPCGRATRGRVGVHERVSEGHTSHTRTVQAMRAEA